MIVVSWEFLDTNTIRVLFKLPGVTGVSGSGQIAAISFKTTGSEGDACVLDVSDGKLADAKGDEIPAVWNDCEVTVGVPVTVNAPEVVSSVSGVFNATIEIEDVTDLHAGQLDLSFDPSVVNVLGVDAGNINGTTIPILGWRFMDDGRIRALFTLSGLDTASGSGYVASIDFETTGSEGDACVLGISNGTLVSITFTELGGATPEEIPAIWTGDEVTLGEPTPLPPTQASVHNIDTGENFSSIQAAINDPATLDGHTIEVEDGVHCENVDVTKSLMIMSENGSSSCIIQAVRGNDHVVEITSDCASMGGFTVEGASAMIRAGIYLNASHCNISNNNCSRNHYGIYLENSTDNNVSDNNCFLNSHDGIYLGGSRNNTVSGNNCSSNGYWGLNLVHKSDNNTLSDNDCSDNGEGVFISDSNNNHIVRNNCSSNKYWGINLVHKSDDSIVFDNNCSNNREGIQISGSNSSVSNNTCSSNDLDGISASGRNNIISNNTCSNNSIGIHLTGLYNGIAPNNDCHLNGIGIQLSSGTNNTVSNNNCSSNTDCGIKLHESGGNRIYLNNFINTRNVRSYESFNTWRSTSEITYIYNRISFAGYLGNYWSDYTREDTDGDGIGDAPYTIDPDYWNEDDYPLMVRFEDYVISKPIYVADTYSTIQQVVDNATKRANITDRDETYVENVGMNKRLTIRSENGSESTIVITESSSENVFEMTADHTTINEFTVAVKHVSGKEVAPYCGDIREP